MRGFDTFLFVVGFAFGAGPVFGQVDVAFGQVVADTALAKQFLNDAIELNTQGKYNDAFVKADSARMIFEKVLGRENRKVADALHQMGRSKYFSEAYDESIILYERSLLIRKQILGLEHLDVATSYNNIAASYQAKEDSEKAIEFYQNALDIRLKILGAEHADVASSYNNIGISHESKGEYAKAIEYKQKALDIRLKTLGSEHSDVATSYNNLGTSYESNGEYDKAIEYCQKALEIRLKTLGPEHLNVASTYNNLGNSYESIGEYDKSIEYHKKALEIRLKTLGPYHSKVATSYNNIGTSFDSKGETKRAIEYYQKALEIRLKTLGVEHPDVANSYNNLGNSYDSEGDYNKSIECFQKAIEIHQKAYGEESVYLAYSYNNIGSTLDSKGEYNKAAKYKQKALEILLKTLGAEHPDLASVYNNIGASCRFKGEFDKAIEYQKKALKIRLKTLGAKHPAVAASYHSIGASYELKGEYDIAIEYKQKCLELELNAFGAKHPRVANSYNDLGVSFNSKKEYEKAIEYYQKDLEIQLSFSEADDSEVAISYFNIGVSYNLETEYDKALQYLQKALEIQLKTLGIQHPDVAKSYNILGNSFDSKRIFNKAIECYQQAITACGFTHGDFSKVNSPEQLIYGFNNLSLTFQKQYLQAHDTIFLTKSHNYALETLECIEHQQSTFSEESSQSFWLSENYPIYEQAISVTLLKADIDHNDTLRHNPFTYAEKSKASLLQSQIKEANAFSGLPDSLLQKEHDLRVDITWREKQRQALIDKGLSETDTNTLRISSIIFDLKNDYETLKKSFETQYPEYYRLKYDLSTVSVSYVQDTLLQPKQALLEYFVGDSSIYLFVVRPDTMIVQEVKRDFPLDDWIEQFRQGLYGFYTAPKSNQTDGLYDKCLKQYLEYAPKLYEKLFAPVKAFLPDHIILVPDGPLGYVPFDALLTAAPKDPNDFKKYPYLLNQHQFSYTYSATLLKEMRDKQHHHEPTKEFVAFAPFYDGDTTLLANMYQYDDLMRKDMQPLAYSGAEVAAASKMMRGEIVAGAAATEERFSSMAGDYRILHLATHGRADNRVGDYAFLAFTEIKDSIENELLYVKDLYNLDLNADLVVLSACETGIGKLQRGEGIISLARAFAHAGAKSIITTLWEVNDKSTSEQMRYFYRELKRGKTKDEPLRLARKRYFSEQSVDVCHPFFWAAFVPVGDMRTVR